MKHRLLLVTLSLFLIPIQAQAKTEEMRSPKNQIDTLSNKMNAIEKNIQQALSTQKATNEALAATEIKLGEQVLNVHNIKQNILNKQNIINETALEISHLKNTLDMQQAMLAHHLQARYSMGKNQPMQWLLSQKKSSHFSRQLTLYQYLIESDKTLITSIRQTTQQLVKKEATHNIELASLNELQNNALKQQKDLLLIKMSHQKLVQAIVQTIKTKKETLKSCQEDQARLQTPLKKVSQTIPKRIIANISAVQLKPHLANPLQNKASHAAHINQGLFFSAPEGLAVNAVLPGTVIFSDWLKGYGLLIIIDHGNQTMTLYAHNESLFKHKGQLVKKGEQIATVGHTGGLRENGLYFEIRRRGKAIPPRQWLS